MRKSEAQRFCSCMRIDIAPRITVSQRTFLTKVQSESERGRLPSQEQFYSTGVRDLVVAAEARCEAAFYPPSGPINVRSGPLQLTLRCGVTTRAPEAFVSIMRGALLSEAELRAATKKMMKGIFDSEYAQVTQKIDGVALTVERWEIDLIGQSVAPPNVAVLIGNLRNASAYEILIQRNQKRYAASFSLLGRIPPRWVPCVGVGR